MSIMNFLEAVEWVLISEMERREDLMILRPGARRALDESEREIALPRLGETSFSIALGAALTGMHPVLDLRQEEDPVSLLIDALAEMPCGAPASLTVIVDQAEADGLLEFSDLRIFHPKNPRQAAGLLRSALRAEGLSLFIADIELSDLTDDVPDDPEFILLPLDGEDAEEILPESCEEEPSEETQEEPAEPELPAEEIIPVENEEACLPPEPCCAPAAEPAPSALFFSMRQIPCDLARLNALTEELDAPKGLLEARCMERLKAEDVFCWQQDASALPGECAFLPPDEKAACLWLGCDTLSITYDSARLSHADAAVLLRAARRLLENPALLIYDKERDLP